MKMRDVGLILAGAAAAVALAAVLPVFVNNANAQSAAASGTPGANPVIVTSAAPGGAGANAGIIVVNDPAAKKITAVSYQFTYYTSPGGTTNAALGLSAKQVFTY